MKRRALAGSCERYATPHVKYRSRAVAEYNASILRAKGSDVRAFKCDRGGGGGCGFWHVGSVV